MTRTARMTFKAIRNDSCNIYNELREDNGAWQAQGIAPMHGTVQEVMARMVERQEHFGWTLLDQEQDNILTFVKEF